MWSGSHIILKCVFSFFLSKTHSAYLLDTTNVQVTESLNTDQVKFFTKKRLYCITWYISLLSHISSYTTCDNCVQTECSIFSRQWFMFFFPLLSKINITFTARRLLVLLLFLPEEIFFHYYKWETLSKQHVCSLPQALSIYQTYLLCTLFALSLALLCLQFREMEMFSYDHSSTFLCSRMHYDCIVGTCCSATPNEWAIAEQCWNV